jgi:hypothetical protein
MRISTKAHGVVDYATAGVLLAAPAVIPVRRPRSRLLLRGAGAGILGTSLATDYGLGVRRRIPMPVHLALDAATGAVLLAAPFLGGGRRRVGDWLPHVLVGAGEIAAAALTERRPTDRADDGGDARPDAVGEQAGAPDAATMPGVVTGVQNPVADDAPAGGLSPRIAGPPIETPGPSVTPPALPESETERAEWVDERRPDAESLGARDPVEQLIAEEESAAAAEAAMIGGSVPSDTEDPAMDPVYQAGGGEQDGWEAAERDLIENATHGDGGGDPLRDALAPEAESDASTAVYGEADRLPSTEVTRDPQPDEHDDPGPDPHWSADRGPGAEPDVNRARER